MIDHDTLYPLEGPYHNDAEDRRTYCTIKSRNSMSTCRHRTRRHVAQGVSVEMAVVPKKSNDSLVPRVKKRGKLGTAEDDAIKFEWVKVPTFAASFRCGSH